MTIFLANFRSLAVNKPQRETDTIWGNFLENVVLVDNFRARNRRTNAIENSSRVQELKRLKSIGGAGNCSTIGKANSESKGIPNTLGCGKDWRSASGINSRDLGDFATNEHKRILARSNIFCVLGATNLASSAFSQRVCPLFRWLQNSTFHWQWTQEQASRFEKMDFYNELFEPEDSNFRPKKRHQKGQTNIRHFMKIISAENHSSESRKTYSELLRVKMRNLKDAFDPVDLLNEIFAILTDRISHDQNKGPPEKIALQWMNSHMEYPFYVPLRPVEQNRPEVLTEAILLLAKQSGGKLKIFSSVNQIKLFGVWPFTLKKKTLWTANAKWRKRRRLYGSCFQNSRLYFDAKKRGILPIFNDDNICLARSIALALIHIYKTNTELKAAISQPNGLQKKIAMQLMKNAKISGKLKKYDLNHVDKLQKYFDEHFPMQIRLVVFHSEKFFKIVYKGKRAKHEICVLLHGHHFDLILSTRKLMQTRGQFCTDCENIVYTTSHNSKCIACCYLCFNWGPEFPCKVPPGQKPIPCSDCGFFFPNRNCLLAHLRKGKKGGQSLCQKRFFCVECKKVVYRQGPKHICLKPGVDAVKSVFFPCDQCKSIRNLNDPHHCYVQPLWFKNDQTEILEEDEIRYVFFDVETTQEQQMIINGVKCRRHSPNLIICEIVCNACANDERVEIPTGNKKISPNALQKAENCCCGIWGSKFRYQKNLVDPQNRRLLKFHSFDGGKPPQDQFIDFLRSQGDHSIKTLAISHNGGKFDLHIVLGGIYRQNLAPKLTMTGLKIYRMELGGSNRRRIIMKDSINFIPGPLSRLFDTFGMQNTGVMKKPAFPHLWNRMENLHKPLDCLPPLRYYCISKMKKDEYEQTVQWYNANKLTPFDLIAALIEYCTNDVQLLRIGCLDFRKIIMQIAPSVDPFAMCSTIATTAITIWRSQFLRPNMMVNLPESGLRPHHLQSNDARRFFQLLSKLTGKEIQTADSIRGEHIPEGMSYRVDGLLLSDNGPPTIIEFNGCRFHGCRRCFLDRKQILQGSRTAEDLFARSQRRKFELERMGYNVLEVWQCRVRQMLSKNAKLRKMWNEMPMPPPPLNPRVNALRGGRVEPFRLYADCTSEPDTVIEHFDFVSMYPSVMKNCKFPIGLPHVYGKEDLANLDLPSLPWSLEKFPNGMAMKGFYMVRILPPERMPKLSATELLPPFLPYRTKEGLLVFPLCSSCAEKQQRKKCRHSDEQRSWIDALMDEDIQLAMQLGYKFLEIYEIWHWDDRQWTDGGEKKDLFKKYINSLLKIKVEASGWPSHVKTPKQKEQFIKAYKEREGIELDAEKMIFNKGLREIMKLLLNALWGKLCQRANSTSVQITKSAREFHELLADNCLEILDVTHLSEHLDRVVFRKKEEFIEAPETNNVLIASCVTSHGRRLLYRKIMEAVEKENLLLYCDTDSIFVKRRMQQIPIKEGIFLGEMAKENPDRRIQKIVIAGAKNYAYLHSALDGTGIQLTRKIRGFEITQNASEKMTFDAIYNQVFNMGSRKKKPISVRYTAFRRTKRGIVYTRPITKEYKAVYKKGIVLGMEKQILPFGHRNI